MTREWALRSHPSAASECLHCRHGSQAAFHGSSALGSGLLPCGSFVRFWLCPGCCRRSRPLGEASVRRAKLEEVIVVSKTHFDIGYTDLASRVVDRYRTSMADQALKLVEESLGLPPDQHFSWTLAGWPMAQILWPGQTPDAATVSWRRCVTGRLVPHAMAFTTHTESLDLEDLTRACDIPWRWRAWPAGRSPRRPR